MTSHRAATNGERLPAAPTLYQLLELAPEATVQELRQAFRVLSKRYHPDTTSLPAAEAREAFSRLNQAYVVLSDPDSRRAYDAQLQRLRAAAMPNPAAGRGAMGAPPAAVRTSPAARPVGVRRSLSGGEWFALVLLALALVLSLVLGVGLAWARGLALITRPSWWNEASGAQPVAAIAPAAAPQPSAPQPSAPQATGQGPATGGMAPPPAVAPSLPQAPLQRAAAALPAQEEPLPTAPDGQASRITTATTPGATSDRPPADVGGVPRGPGSRGDHPSGPAAAQAPTHATPPDPAAGATTAAPRGMDTPGLSQGGTPAASLSS